MATILHKLEKSKKPENLEKFDNLQPIATKMLVIWEQQKPPIYQWNRLRVAGVKS